MQSPQQFEDIADAIYGDGVTSGLGSLQTASGLGLGDLAAGGLWAVALYFCSPLQLLLLFLGRIETERPSDWVLRQLGRLTGQRVEDPAYSAPLLIRVPTVLLFAASGAAVAWAFQAGLGDGTWSISTGIGACMAAAVYEVGRPDRLNPEEAVELESQWQEFARFADARLQRSGRCHESEIRAALKVEVRRFRSPDSLSSSALRDMIRNWHPNAERTASGYYKNLALRQRVDPFTGEMTGSAAAVGTSKSEIA
ncbi:hypothetical protein COCSUDRAFT_55711 [Coccomyxa subellipsoidea C-169]|uniref:Uncharacterized protein n=1 Tax=Coccomyxa subellipsoidea (strain C-169) TaxID=574566 RepID=I0ZAQ7_COCSC|nr:hypothetical protein COCSUDRAFT_55711 [Coccomyxa subellipsoidea C-169]EIE27726.1 hypothetical protein COCSUDRAFT_55711 [Coccomyxa subellipsoidea C-169]|eukprot:XP_005652270.1 hypothetical protein COCSUDRAFT_55711 [Coccomyxa subellipsoidea C-169]